MAIIKEKGTIAFMSEVQSGMSQNGNPWYRQTIVVDIAGYNGSYRKLALQASGNIVGDLEDFMVGDKVEVSYQVTAREYNGKWYNNVDLYRIDPEEAKVAEAAPQYQQQPMVQPGAYPQNQPQQPTPSRRRPRRDTTPLVPPGANLDPQNDDLPWG